MRATHQCATSCFPSSLPFSPSFFLLEEWEEVIIQRPPAPMPQLFSSMALCLFRERPITLSGVMPRSKRQTEWKFIGRWRRGGEAERKGETWVMDEFDSRYVQCKCIQITNDSGETWLLSLSLSSSQPSSLGGSVQTMPAGRREKKGTNNIWMQIHLILCRCLSAIAHGLKSRWFKLLFVKVDFRRT